MNTLAEVTVGAVLIANITYEPVSNRHSAHQSLTSSSLVTPASNANANGHSRVIDVKPRGHMWQCRVGRMLRKRKICEI